MVMVDGVLLFQIDLRHLARMQAFVYCSKNMDVSSLVQQTV
jgi:hypothetical protein